VKSGDHEAIFTGDAIHSTVQCQHPEWHFTYDADAEMAVTSPKQLLENTSETGCIVLGSHFALPSLGREKLTKTRSAGNNESTRKRPTP